ncbi:hypothetical protein QTH87_25290 [Variovorax sp. J22P168]|uniref:hypothetical protein n=1 Tax=Variovorax jilinensis TaxID=3053513 RepID=UPI002575BD17|nr:hypothetical protein [Variovorax sp. J22P168]MDM0015778.1 hypothetical protein [Variovorax sp. J22P168]
MSADFSSIDELDAELGRLIADAQLVQRHLADSGRLLDTALGDAIELAVRNRGTSEALKAYSILSVQYSKALNLSEKVSIDELRNVHSKLYSSRWGGVRQITTALFAIILIGFAVIGFVVVQNLNDNIAQLTRINTQNPLQKLTELRRIISEGALRDPKSAYYGQYLKAHHEVALMFDSANRILARTAASSQRRSQPPLGEYGVTASVDEVGIVNQIINVVWFELFGPAQPPQNAVISQTPLQIGSKHASMPVSAPSVGGTLEGVYENVALINEKNCKPYNDAPVRALYGKGNQQFLLAALDKFDDFCLAQTLDIRVGSYRPASAIHAVHVLQDQLFIIGVLFLPMIGGLLGATISIIYAIINNTRSAQLSPGYMAVRIAVGGAFGVIIGWFSATGPGSSSDFVQHVSGTPFTLAILAGFSVQLLSAVLMTFSATLERQNATDKIRKPAASRAAGAKSV